MATQSTTRKHSQAEKKHLQAVALLNRVYAMAMDETLPAPVQVQAAKLYLSKVMPDLKSVAHSGEMIQHVTGIDIRIIDGAGTRSPLELGQIGSGQIAGPQAQAH